MHENVLYAAIGVLIALTLALGYTLYVARNPATHMSGAAPADMRVNR